MRKTVPLLFALYLISICPVAWSQELGTARNNTLAETNEASFFELYENWLPKQIVSSPSPARSDTPPQPNLPNGMEFGGGGYISNDTQSLGNERLFNAYFAVGKYLHEDESPYVPDDEFILGIHIRCPFPDFLRQLSKAGYKMGVNNAPRYTVFPMLGRFYCIDCPEGKDSDKLWLTSAFRLQPTEEPAGITVQRESIVFPYSNSFNNGRLYGYIVVVKEFVSDTENPLLYRAKVGLWRSTGTRQLREAWFTVGDVLEFYDKGHKIINIGHL